MHRRSTWALAIVAAITVASTLGLSGAAVSGAAVWAGQPERALARLEPGEAASPGAQLWADRFNGEANSADSADAVAVSPDGSTVFVTGYSTGASTADDYATIAYNVATGAKVWERRYNGPHSSDDIGYAIVVSPDGSTVFVTGSSVGNGTGYDCATIAYNAATGTRQWLARYNGVAEFDDQCFSAAVSPDGSTVYVTGYSQQGLLYLTIAYNAATGAQRWVALYDDGNRGANVVRSVAVSPDGSMVFVTGASRGNGTGYDYATVAYDAADGAQLWASRYNGPGNGDDEAASLAVSPDGSTVFVTGYGTGTTGLPGYETVAYSAATGAQAWARRYTGPGTNGAKAAAAAVSPDGSTVFVTGYSYGARSQQDYATLAYNAATGTSVWSHRYNGPANSDDLAAALTVSPDGSAVYVTGESAGVRTGGDYATLGYNATTGATLWLARYNGSGQNNDTASAIAVSPDGSTVFVTGTSTGATSGLDYATIAYQS
jgi:WD40 repeat protein